MKKLIVLWIVLALLVSGVTPAFAGRGSGGDGGNDRSGQQSGPGGGEQEPARNQEQAGDPEQEREREREQERDQEPADDPEQEQEREREQERNRDGDPDQAQEPARVRVQERVQRFALEGRIAAIDRAAGAITIAVTGANRFGERIMQRIEVRVKDGTMLQRKAGDLWGPAKLGDYRVGQSITAHGTIDAGSWTATRIRMGARP